MRSSGTIGSFVSEATDLKQMRDACVDVLKAQGYTLERQRAFGDKVIVTGLRGSKLLAILASQFPILQLLGVGSRVRTTIRARRSLDAGDETLRVNVGSAPVQEWTNDREEFLLTQGVGERLGDHLQSRRRYREVVAALRDDGIIGEAARPRIELKKVG